MFDKRLPGYITRKVQPARASVVLGGEIGKVRIANHLGLQCL